MSKPNQKPVARHGSRKAKVVQVILVETLIGKGSEEDPLRVVNEYWSLDGDLLAVTDPPEHPVF